MVIMLLASTPAEKVSQWQGHPGSILRLCTNEKVSHLSQLDMASDISVRQLETEQKCAMFPKCPRTHWLTV